MPLRAPLTPEVQRPRTGVTIGNMDAAREHHVFVLGLDEANEELLEAMPDTESVTFHQLLTRGELQDGRTSVPDLLRQARAQLNDFDGSIDAIMTYWDFPATMMVPILCREYDLHSARLEAVVALDHKYWSRLIQSRVTDDIPAFGLLDLDATEPHLPRGVDYPAWIKPVQSASSEGAYYIEGADQLATIMPTAREQAERTGEPFEDILALIDLPPEVEKVGGAAYLAEESATGHQVTIEGYVYNDQPVTYGLVESITYPDSPSFLRYQYPSRMSQELYDRIADISARVVGASGLNNSTFNIEFFWDPRAGRLRLLEANARHSQSHAAVFELVEGVTNHHAMLFLAMGRPPEAPAGGGPYATAAKWFLRHFADGVVRQVPTADQIAEFTDRNPGSWVEPTVAEGDRLSEGYGEDSYSFVLAEVVLAGDDTDHLERQWEDFLATVPFRVDDEEEEGT